MSVLLTKQQQVKVQTAEAIKGDAALFVKQLKLLARGSDTVNGMKLKDLLYSFDHCDAFNQLSVHYQSKVPKPHKCAEQMGLIKIIRDGNNPYTYQLLAPDETKIILRPYQIDIIDRSNEAKGSVLIEAPTGSGKSVMASHIARHEINNGGIVLIVAPKITLIEQLADTFKDLEPQTIHGAKDYDSSHSVFVSTLQTAHKRDLGFTPTMILIDEVHFGFSGKMIKQLLKDFNGKLIGLSATPYDKQGRPLQGFNLHVNNYDMRYMIEKGYLVPPISYAPVKVDLSKIRTTAGDYNQSDLDAKFNNIESVMQVVDSTKAMIQSRKQALVFCITIKHAEAMANAYNDAGIPSHAMHSQMTKEEQAEVMAAFRRGDIKLLSNPDMLTTGFDHPPTDTVILARATKSQNLYKQMVGRALRLHGNKKDAVLLDCAGVIDDLGLPTEPIKESRKKAEADTKQKRCVECESKRVYRRVKADGALWVCAECGHSEPIEDQSGYECSACGLIHGRDASFSAKDGKLYLQCKCGAQTLISEATTHDELQAIFDSVIIGAIQRRVTAQYVTWLIDKYGAGYPFEAEPMQQIKAVQDYIAHYPHTLPNFDSRLIQPDGWRLLPTHYKAIDRDALKDNFYNARYFDEAVTAVNELLKANGQSVLKSWVIEKTVQQINESNVNGIEAMTVKRIKNLYSNGKDCNSIDTFIPYIEKQRKNDKVC